MHDPVAVGLGQHTQLHGRPGDQRRSHRHGFAVVHAVRTFLDGMRQRVPEVQFAAVARLAFVALDDVGLDADRRRNGIRQQVGVRSQRPECRPLDASEQVGIGDDRRLDHFGQSGPELPLGKRAQQRGVADDELRLGEGSGHVLVAVDVHAVLAAHRSVDLPQQRRRDESEFHAAHVGRCGESRHVGDDAAPDRQHEGRTVHAQLDETAVDHLDGLHRLDALAQADQHGVVLRQHRMVQPVDRGVGDHHHAPLGERSGENVGHRTYENFALLANVEGRFHYLTF